MITWFALLKALGVIAGVLTFAVGALMAFAGGMSDNPEAGDAAGKQGCITAIVGLIVLLAAIFIGHWRA